MGHCSSDYMESPSPLPVENPPQPSAETLRISSCPMQASTALLSAKEPKLAAETFSVELHSKLDSIPKADWERLLPTLPDSYAMVALNQHCGVDGFNFYSLVVKAEQTPILYLPLFSTEYNMLESYNGIGKNLLRPLAQRWPQLLALRALGIGFVEGEWGETGYDRKLSEPLLLAAWQLAEEALEQLAQSLQAGLIGFVDFKEDNLRNIPMEIRARYTPVSSYPYGVLPLDFRSLEGYLAQLSKATRKDLRRKLKAAAQLELRYTAEPSPTELQRIYTLYLETVARSDSRFGVQGFRYFQEACQNEPGATYALYYHQGRLIGFNLLASKNQTLVDKYFGMEQETGKAMNLYFISWLENLRYCLDHSFDAYLAGPAAESLKIRLGAKMFPTWIYFRHRTPWLHKCLSLMAPQFAYQAPNIENQDDISPEAA